MHGQVGVYGLIQQALDSLMLLIHPPLLMEVLGKVLFWGEGVEW